MGIPGGGGTGALQGLQLMSLDQETGVPPRPRTVVMVKGLLTHNPPGTPIQYRPDEFMDRYLRRPIAFVDNRYGVTPWIQMKDLPTAERENKVVDRVKEQLRRVKGNMFIWCDFSEVLSPSGVSHW